MRRRAFLLLSGVAWLSAVTASAGPPHSVAACAAPDEWQVPRAAGADGPHASHVPFVSAPSELRAADGTLAVRYQQLVAASALRGPVTLTAVHVRLDAATPPAGGDVALAVELRVGPGPRQPSQLRRGFADNERGPQALVFDGVLAVGSAPTLRIPFDTPVVVDPRNGGLLLDFRVRGAFGDDLVFALDADLGSRETGHIFALDSLDLPLVGPSTGGLVLTLEGVPGRLPADPVGDCLRRLPLSRFLSARLEGWLRAARRAASVGEFPLARRLLEAYERDVRRLAARRRVSPATAESLRHVGAVVAHGVEGSAALVVAGHDLGFSMRLGTYPLAVEASLVPFVLPSELKELIREKSKEVDALTGPILRRAMAGEPIDDEEWDRMMDALRELVELTGKDETLDAQKKQEIKDLVGFVGARVDSTRLARALQEIFEDGRLDRGDAGRLKEIAEILTRGRMRVQGEGAQLLLDSFARTARDLGALLDSGKLVGIEFGKEDGCRTIKFDVKDGEVVKIPIFDLVGLDTRSWYGKTNLTLYFVVTKDTTIRFCDDPFRVEFVPPDGVHLDLDSSGIFVVDYIEGVLGIDLDRLSLRGFRTEDGKMVFEATSRGEKVTVTIVKGEIEVDVGGRKATYVLKNARKPGEGGG